MKLFVFIAFILLFPVVARADHASANLDDLFQKLQTAADSESARVIEQSIWDYWLDSERPMITARMEVGIYFMRQGNWQMAHQVFSDVIKRAPNYAEGWNKRATVEYIMGDLQPSVVDIQKTLELEPRHFGALSGLGLIYIALGKPQTALKVFSKVLEIYPQNTGVQEKIKSLEKMISGNPA